MRAFARIAALIAPFLGESRAFERARKETKISPRALASFFRRHRRGGGNHGRYTRALRAKFAKNALSRYGLDEDNALKMVTAEHRRRMRNARKRQRAADRGIARRARVLGVACG